MTKALWASAVSATIGLAGCHAGNSPTSAPPTFRMASSIDEASMQQGQAAYRALVARGMVYHISGRVGNITVASVNGKTHITAFAMPGEYVNVDFVKGSHDTVDFDRVGQRGSLSLPGACADCEGGGGNNTGTPKPQQTAPPNFDSCKAAGGATWFDAATGAGGCLGPGASKGFPCGIWSYSSPGHGRYRDWGGTTDYSGFDWFSSNPDGSCQLGPYSPGS